MYVESGHLNLRDWNTRYASSDGNLVASFYRPVLDAAHTYSRAAGYFRSSLYSLVGASAARFARRGGHMRLLCSAQLTRADARLIDDALRADQTDATRAEVHAILDDPVGRTPHDILRALLGSGCLEIRLAITDAGRGIFHSKVGILEDTNGHALSFSGSANESWSGWHPLGNHETFEVFTSWQGDDGRVEGHRRYFETLWSGRAPGITVLSVPEALKSGIVDFVVPADPVDAMEIRVTEPSAAPALRPLLDHQRTALANWRAAERRGIFVHATGSGKTVTGLHAIRDCFADGLSALVLVPSTLLLDQWADEARRELGDLAPSILLAGAGNTGWRRGRLLESHLAGGTTCRVVIATIATATSPRFLVALAGGNYVLVGDEVHRLGARRARTILDTANPAARLGLSATPVRAFDPDGTLALARFFGAIVPPVVTLQDAIDAGRLCEYEYWPTIVDLDSGEQEQWAELSRKITLRFAREAGGKSIDFEPSDDLKQLLIRRARIAKNAAAKLPAVSRIVGDNYERGQRWIVYCEDQRQVEAVSAALRAQNIPTSEYHSSMTGSRPATLRAFREEGGVLVSIRCLDEGVDIPEVTHALIVASSRNSREFIQRRGRVLRTSASKHFATVFDVLVLPERDPGGVYDGLIAGELVRAAEFADSAVNRSARSTLETLAEAHGIDLTASNFGFDFPDDSDDEGLGDE